MYTNKLRSGQLKQSNLLLSQSKNHFNFENLVIFIKKSIDLHKYLKKKKQNVYAFTFTFTCASASHFRLKFFKSLYLLTMLMDQVDTLHVARYWSEVLCSTIMTHPG